AFPGQTRPRNRVRHTGGNRVGWLHVAHLHVRPQHKSKPRTSQREKCGEENQRAVVHGLASAVSNRSAVAPAYAAAASAREKRLTTPTTFTKKIPWPTAISRSPIVLARKNGSVPFETSVKAMFAFCNLKPCTRPPI